MPRSPVNLHRVARQCRVHLVDAADNRSTGRPDGLCSCKATARAIGREHGEAHLALCFRLLTETGNGKAIHAASLKAVSALILSGYVEIDGTLFDAFDKIDVNEMRLAMEVLPAPAATGLAGALLALVVTHQVGARLAA